MDGFIDFKNNMPFLNDEYELAKKIYGKRFDVYTSSNDFLWSNQSFTIQAKSLFKQMNGFFLPESSYNEKTMTMLDVYYPRALKWFTTEQLPHEEIEEITIDKIFLEPTIGQLASLWLVLLLLVSLLIGILI